ncbi:TetR/AcrR family transcriptional regulator [Xylanimonas oleitrophica]|uniref:TetR/AcrR family transcriptional regulator n=1 Tax=Xylanimonas oleitrophica TaxID=2607479 RepID=A0A2W5WTQ0_9MICO|nr:TetR/AcrR family transcriptional regulator [Xylanimonas oleitrophica]PZR51616.1 TetR/AcrR family transcriptional regulator [Xylanimonas oleitrophica]
MTRKPLAERRAQLVEAALRVAAQAGVEAVTVRAVAHEAGVSLGTVHYCFEDKDELLDAMGHSVGVQASEQIRAAIAAGGRAGLDYPTLAHQCAGALLEGLKQWRQVRLLLLEIATTGARNPALRATARSHLQQSTEMAKGLVATIAEAAGVRYRVDLDFLARVVTAVVDGIELAWLVDEDDRAALDSFHALADLLTTYVDDPEREREDEGREGAPGAPSTVST